MTKDQQAIPRINILILGIGNILLNDEGAGVRAVELLQKRFHIPPEVEVLDGGTSGLDILPHLEGRTHLFIIDVLDKDGLAPGEAVKIDISNQPGFFRQKISPHQLGLSEVLAVAFLQDMLPKTILLFGIKPKDLGTGLDLTPEVKTGLEKIITEIQQELAKAGLVLQKK